MISRTRNFITKQSATTIGFYAGSVAVVVGMLAFALSWNLWDFWGGPMPGIQVILFPGNLTLIHAWHPLFTEELGFWPKFALHMFGQFFVVACVVTFVVGVVRKISVIRT